MLPTDIWRRIFEYDPTYKDLFRKCIDEIPDIQIEKTHKSHYSTSMNIMNNRFSFNMDTISGPLPYIYLAFKDFSFFGNFTKMEFVNTDNQHRFIYNNSRRLYDPRINSSIVKARLDGIDTRLRKWEWWITLYYNNTTTILSCNYQQMHGIYIELTLDNTQTRTSKRITENDAIIIYNEIKDTLLNSSEYKHVTTQYKDFPIYHQQGIIPNATIRTYDFSSYLML